jgi:thioredoxin 1
MSSSVVVEIDSEEKLTEQLTKFAGVIVDFGAEWCGPCRTIKPYYHKLASQHTSLSFCSVDIDHLQQLAEKFGVSSVPTFVMFLHGEEIRRFSGADKKKLNDLVNEAYTL